MSERDKSLLADVLPWLRKPRPEPMVRRAPHRTAMPPRRRANARAADDAATGLLEFTLDGGVSPGTLPGYNPYDNLPRPVDTLPWKPVRRS